MVIQAPDLIFSGVLKSECLVNEKLVIHLTH